MTGQRNTSERYTVHNERGDYLCTLFSPIMKFTAKAEAAILFHDKTTADKYAQRIPGGYVDTWRGSIEPLLGG